MLKTQTVKGTEIKVEVQHSLRNALRLLQNLLLEEHTLQLCQAWKFLLSFLHVIFVKFECTDNTRKD